MISMLPAVVIAVSSALRQSRPPTPSAAPTVRRAPKAPRATRPVPSGRVLGRAMLHSPGSSARSVRPPSSGCAGDVASIVTGLALEMNVAVGWPENVEARAVTSRSMRLRSRVIEGEHGGFSNLSDRRTDWIAMSMSIPSGCAIDGQLTASNRCQT